MLFSFYFNINVVHANNYLLNSYELTSLRTNNYHVECKFTSQTDTTFRVSSQVSFRISFHLSFLLSQLTCDLVVGADGLYSSVRSRIPTSVSQYITDYCYKVYLHVISPSFTHDFRSFLLYQELTIAPSEDQDFIMDSHSIHVFPRGKYFMIALPNEDKTFRCTLVMPSSGNSTTYTSLLFFTLSFVISLQDRKHFPT